MDRKMFPSAMTFEMLPQVCNGNAVRAGRGVVGVAEQHPQPRLTGTGTLPGQRIEISDVVPADRLAGLTTGLLPAP